MNFNTFKLTLITTVVFSTLFALANQSNIDSKVKNGQNPISVEKAFVSQVQKLFLSKTIFQNSGLIFKINRGQGPFDSYLAMNIQFDPVKSIYQSMKQGEYSFLLSRGESHITVITPVEFRTKLESRLSIAEINEIAIGMKIQESKFDLVGIGSGKALVNGKMEETFFIVIRSVDLLNIRRAVHKRFIENGGSPESFDPEKFYSHITVGFTKMDLHESNGVFKDEHSIDRRFELVLTPD